MSTDTRPETPTETLIARETREAPGAVAKQFRANEAACRKLGERLHAYPPNFVVTCARSSSDHAASFGKYLIERYTGRMTARPPHP